MEPKFQTTFIPKSPVVSGTKEVFSEPQGKVTLLSILAMIVFMASILASGGLFLYTKVQEKSLADLKASMSLEKESFNESIIKDLILASDQIKAVKNLLDNHLILSNIFAVLQSSTIQNINFTEISFETKNEGFVKVSFKGLTTSYDYIAKQSELFKSTGFLNEVSFHNIEVDKDGNLVFEGTLSVNIESTLYREVLKKLSLSN